MSDSKIIAFDELDRWTQGKSKDLQFVATESDIRDWLIEGLLHEYGPYSMLATDGCEIFESPVSDLLSNNPRSASLTNHFIRSERMQGSKFDVVPEMPRFLLDKYWNFNGSVILQHGMSRRPTSPTKKQGASRIMVVYSVVNVASREEVVHKQSLEIFNALAKRIKRDLTYSTIDTFLDGQECEDTRTIKMTARAVKAYEAGFPFFLKPGRKLEKAK